MAEFTTLAAEWILEVALVIIAGQSGLIFWLLRRHPDPEEAPAPAAGELEDRLKDQEIQICVKNLAKTVTALQKSVDYLNREVAWLRGHYAKQDHAGKSREQLG